MSISTNENDQGKINRAIQQLEQGRLNVTGRFTLTPAATTTVVKAPNCGALSEPQFSARTANAAAALATTYISAVANGSFTVTHVLNGQTDRTFGFVAIG